MLYIFIIFILICLIKIKYKKEGFENYLGKEQTTAIKGIFAIIIFFSHFNSYITLSNLGQEKIYSTIIRSIGQLMVAIFLFYSGYGIFHQGNKKKDYIKSFPKNRIINTLISFDLAVLIYLVANIFLNIKYPIKDVLLSFTGWIGIGNSNWFIFSILLMYIITYISAIINNKKIDKHTIILITILSMIFIVVMKFVKARYWYDTILCYSAGLWYGLYKERIDKILKDKYILAFIGTLITFIILYIFSKRLIIYEIMSIVFCLLIIIITYRFRIRNRILDFLGAYSFEIYILQRLPDIILQRYTADKIYLYFFASLICTIILAYLFKKITDNLYRIKSIVKYNKKEEIER